MTHTAIESDSVDIELSAPLKEMIKKTNQEDLPMMVASLVFGWEDGDNGSSINQQ